MPLIITITIVIYIILITWTWKNLGNIEKSKKVTTIIIELLLIYFVTLIIFSISKQGIVYKNIEIANSVRNMIVLIFTGVNGLVIMPIMGKMLDKVKENEIDKETFSKRALIILLVVIIVFIIECGYMKNTQEGILKVYNSMVTSSI